MKIALLACGLMTLGLMGCTTLATKTPQKLQFSQEKQCPNPLDLRVGERFSVTLDENLSTGAMWTLNELNYLKMETMYASQFNPMKKNYPPVVGGGDEKIYVFTALRAGTETIQAQYGRGWEQSSFAKWQCKVRITA